MDGGGSGLEGECRPECLNRVGFCGGVGGFSLELHADLNKV